MKAPIIICGCHGGGTSYIAKLLRYQGLFLGADAGPLTSRKYHESKAFRRANESILELFGDKWGVSETTVTALLACLEHSDRAESIARELNIDAILNRFWGEEDRAKAWGWKDPRNSLTVPVWWTFFPGARVVVVRKRVDRKPAQSTSGKWFREIASPWMRKQYTHPWWLRNCEKHLVVHFERVVTEVDVFNELLHFAGVSTVKPDQFSRVRSESGFEGF